MSGHKNPLIEDYQKAKERLLMYMQELGKADVPPSIGRNIAEYETDRIFVDTLRNYGKSVLDVPSDCPLGDAIKQYNSVIEEYTNIIQKKWIFAGNTLEKRTDNKNISDTFDPILKDISARINSICEACRIKHEYEKK